MSKEETLAVGDIITSWRSSDEAYCKITDIDGRIITCVAVAHSDGNPMISKVLKPRRYRAGTCKKVTAESIEKQIQNYLELTSKNLKRNLEYYERVLDTVFPDVIAEKRDVSITISKIKKIKEVEANFFESLGSSLLRKD
jgi:hypothetical protein